MSEKQPCLSCPIQSGIEIARDIIEDTPSYYVGDDDVQKKITLGSLIQDEVVLAKIVIAIGCTGPSKTDGGQVVCPHATTLEGIQTAVRGPNVQSRQLFDYTAYLGETPADKTRGTGQYL